LLPIWLLIDHSTATPALGSNSTANISIGTTSFPVTAGTNSSECYLSWQSYQSSRDSFMTEHASSSIGIATYFREIVFLAPEQTGVVYTTLCDGVPRANGSPVFSANTTYLTVVPNTTTFWPSYTVPTPSCSLDPPACSSLWQSYSQAAVMFSADSELRSQSIVTTLGPVEPQPPACVPPTSICGGCTVHGSEARLVYWPVTTISGDVCSHPGITIKPNITGPVTTDISGIKLTSPTAYIFVDVVWANDFCTRKGPTISNAVIPVLPNSLYSGVGLHGMDPESFNLADLYPGHVPFLNYEQMRECPYYPEFCTKTIYEEWYHPNVMMPADVTNLDPAWATCTPSHFGLFDPPVAAMPVSAFISTTTNVPLQSQTQNPSPGSIGTTVVSTQAPVVSPADPSTAPKGGDPPQSSQNTANPQPAQQASSAGGGIAVPSIGSGDPAQPASGGGGKGALVKTSMKPFGEFIWSGFGGIWAENGSPQSLDPPSAAVVIGSITISIGRPTAAISEHVVSAASNSLVINGASITFPSSGMVTEALGAVITLGSQALTAMDSSGIVTVGSITISLGGPAATISGHVISAATNGLVVDGTTTDFSFVTQPPGTSTQASAKRGGNPESGMATTTNAALYSVFTGIAPSGRRPSLAGLSLALLLAVIVAL